MEKRSYGIIDIAKFIAALLVIAIHCAPFYEINETWNFIYVQIISRLAVPFFFTVSGWLFFQKLDLHKGARDEANRKALQHYWLRIAKLYLAWSALYLPLLVISWIKGGFTAATCIRLLRDFLFNGTYYHLWFLPALLLGIVIVYALVMKWGKRFSLIVCGILYLIGMVLNVYGPALHDVVLLGNVIQCYESVLATARNGIFFAPLFLILGIYAQDFMNQQYKKQTLLAFVISMIALCLEAFGLRSFGIMNDLTCMYLFLVPSVFFLLLFLLQFSFAGNQLTLCLRKLSLLIYVSHIYFITLFMNVLQLSNFSVYVLTIIASCLCSWAILYYAKRFPQLKVLI